MKSPLRGRWPWLLGLIAAGLVLVWLRGLAPVEATTDYSVYLPLAWRGAVREDLPTPQSVVAPSPTTPTTATDIATVEASPTTITATPSETLEPSITPSPAPTATPTKLPTGSISGRLLVDGRPATIGLGLYLGPALYLRRCAGGGADCTIVDRTGVENDEGQYWFRGAAPLAAGEFYQILWVNEDNPPEMMGDLEYLGTWYGPRITKYDAGDEVSGFDFELSNLELTAPSNGTSFGFPGSPSLQFEWEKRKSEVGDFTYRWGICSSDSGCCQSVLPRQTAWLTGPLGQANKWLMTAYPPNVQVGSRQHPFEYPYCWFIRIQSQEAYTYGESFYIRKIWFYQTLTALSGFGLVDVADWAGAEPRESRGEFALGRR